MTMLALALMIYVHFSWHRADDFGMEYHGVFKRNFSLRWDEADSIYPDPSPRSSALYIESGRRKMTLPGALTGFPEFAVLVIRHLHEEKWRPATKVIGRTLGCHLV
jgi:hypothetical protein